MYRAVRIIREMSIFVIITAAAEAVADVVEAVAVDPGITTMHVYKCAMSGWDKKQLVWKICYIACWRR